jgi:hypothetical protein
MQTGVNMKFPNFKMNKWFTARAFVLLAGLFLMALMVPAQKTEAGASPTLSSCRNESAANPAQCIDGAWVTGAVNATHSHYAETQFLPSRLTLTGTSNITYTFGLGYDMIDSKHAVDYLASFDLTETTANPCHDVVAGCSPSAPDDRLTIPVDTSGALFSAFLGGQVPTPTNPVDRELRIWGGTFIHNPPTYNTYQNGDTHRTLTFQFKPNCNAQGCSDIVIAWGAHIAWSGDWGPGNSAGGISGASYHQSQDVCVGFPCGSRDIQLMTAGIAPAALVKIIKYAETLDGSGVANTQFGFTASSSFGTTAFNLVDSFSDNPVRTGAEKDSIAITSFDGIANNITVTENNVTGWTLSDITCTNNFAGSSSSNLGTRSASISVSGPGGLVTCAFTNSQLQITAAPASVSGRVTTALGSGISGARVSIVDFATGETRVALTNTFGYYSFTGLEVTHFYQLGVSAKKYTFQQSVKSFSLTSVLSDVNFVAN